MAKRQISKEKPSALSDSDDQQIMIKNIETGLSESSKSLLINNSGINLSQTVLQPWSDYFSDLHKLKQQLYTLVVRKQFQLLENLLSQFPIQLNQFIYMGGWSLLHYSVSQNDSTAANILLKFGLSPDLQTKETHRTALHQASLINSMQVARCLITWGADPNIVDVDRNTALHFAVDYGYVQMTKIILGSAQMVDLTIRNCMNMTPFNTCRNPQIFDLLDHYNNKHSHKKTLSTQSPSNSPTRIEVYQSRLVRNQEKLMPQMSRVDQVEKFLSMRQFPKKQSQENRQSIVSSLSEISQQGVQQVCKSSRMRGRGSRQARYLKNRNILKGCNKVRQNLGLAKQSIFQSHIEKSEQISNFDILKKIGKGAFAEVFLARKKRSSNIYAMKRLSKRTIIDNGLQKYIYAQRKVYTQLQHPFLIQAHYCLQDLKHLYLLMQLCPHGDLQNFVRNQPIPQSIAKTYFCQAALALSFMHFRGMLYRDLKVANILLDHQGHIKLADFGLSKQAVTSDSFVGSVSYIAPELLIQGQKKPHGQPLDWYLLGIFLYEMLHGEPPFYQEDRLKMEQDIRNSAPKIKESVSHQCRELLLALLAKQPKERPCSWQDVIKFQWLKGVTEYSILKKQGQVLKLGTIDDKQLRKKEYLQQQQERSNNIDCNVQWFENWNYPSLKN